MDGYGFSMDITGIKDALGRLSVENYLKALEEGLQKSMFVVEGEAKQETPVDKGILRQGFRTKYESTRAILSNIRNYAVFVHDGTGKYAKGGGGRATAWLYMASNGKFYRTKGQKPNPFMERASLSAEDKVRAVFSSSISRFTSKV